MITKKTIIFLIALLFVPLVWGEKKEVEFDEQQLLLREELEARMSEELGKSVKLQDSQIVVVLSAAQLALGERDGFRIVTSMNFLNKRGG